MSASRTTKIIWHFAFSVGLAAAVGVGVFVIGGFS